MEKVHLKFNMRTVSNWEEEILFLSENIQNATNKVLHGFTEVPWSSGLNDFIRILLFDLNGEPPIKDFLLNNRVNISSLLVWLVREKDCTKDRITKFCRMYPFLDLMIVDYDHSWVAKLEELITEHKTTSEIRKRLLRLLVLTQRELSNIDKIFQEKETHCISEIAAIREQLALFNQKGIEMQPIILKLKPKPLNLLSGQEREYITEYQSVLSTMTMYQKIISETSTRQMELAGYKRKERQFYSMLKNLVEVELKTIDIMLGNRPADNVYCYYSGTVIAY